VEEIKAQIRFSAETLKTTLIFAGTQSAKTIWAFLWKAFDLVGIIEH
jgi:hypothetical protein